MTSPDVNRERDQTGRPRNARPRDELGRPLPRGDSGVVGIPDDLVLTPQESLTEAQRLLDEGRPFHAHEVLEAAWKSAPDAERDLWQGLAQLAVGLTHALRGNTVGAATLLRRGADRISGYADSPGPTVGRAARRPVQRRRPPHGPQPPRPLRRRSPVRAKDGGCPNTHHPSGCRVTRPSVLIESGRIPIT